MINFKDLTIKEKLSLLQGESFWKTRSIKRASIKSKTLSDGPHGIRVQTGRDDMLGLNKSLEAICYPTASLSACSFDNDLVYRMGVKMGLEAKSKGVDLILGPGMNIKRNPLCGRAFEYFSEDSYLSSRIAGNMSKGIESTGVGACLKHFVLNNQENYRMTSNSIIDERTLYEVYLKNFGDAVSIASPTAIMTSYNKVNNLYMSQNNYLLDYMRKEYCFKGLYVTDWGGLANLQESFKNGLNLEMPGCDKTRVKTLYKAYKKGLITEEEIDKASKPIYDFACKEVKTGDFDKDEASKLALEVAQKSMVLLKNDNKLLPLEKEDKLLVIGELAKNPRYQGAGSSKINPYYVTSLTDSLDSKSIKYDFAWGYKDDKIVDDYLDKIDDNTKIILTMGLPDSYESEGFDRTSMKLPACQLELIDNLYKVNKNIIVVLMTGSPVELPLDKMPSLLLAYLGGMEVGNAITSILTGEVNPSGRLAETWPIKIEDIGMPTFGIDKNPKYTEGEYLGYKYYHSIHQDVNFPFGFGLSYSEVNYSDFVVTNEKIILNIMNNGVPCEEVVELYLENEGEFNYRRLIGYQKIKLDSKESKEVIFNIDDEWFKMYDINTHSFKSTSGKFKVLIGKSARNIIFYDYIIRHGDIEYTLPCHNNELEDNTTIDSHKFNMNSTLDDLNRTRLGRFILKIVSKETLKITKENPEMAPMINAVLASTPLRQIPMSTGFKFNYLKVQGLIDLLNGHVIKGIIGLLK